MKERNRTYYGVSVGILMVKTSFMRFRGDVGNALTWNFPVQFKVVDDAVPTKMTELHNSSLLEPFKRAAQELIDQGVDGIATTCGFLSIYQKELADFCSVPVATSSLLQVPMVDRIISSKKRVGVLTFSKSLMNPEYLETVGVPLDTPIMGMPADCEFARSIMQGDITVPLEVLRDDVLAAAGRLLEESPDIGAIVLECTNMAPFSRAISEKFDVPVYDIITMIEWFHSGLQPRRYD